MATTSSRDYRAARALIGLVPQELHTDAFESGVGYRHVQPRLVQQAEEPGLHRESPARAVAMGQEGQQDHDALGRHETPGADRKGAHPRAADPLPRRADRRRRCRTAQGHVAGGARPARFRRHHHPDHALHRRSRGHGRPRRRHQQRRDHPGRGKGRADAQARKEAADLASRSRSSTRFRRNFAPSSSTIGEDGSTLIYDYDTKAERTGVATLLGELSRAGLRFRDLQTDAVLAGGHLCRTGE